MLRFRRVISLVLSLVLVLGMCPQYAFAADEVQPEAVTEETLPAETAAITEPAAEEEPAQETVEETTEETVETTLAAEPVEETETAAEVPTEETEPEQETEAPAEDEEPVIHTDVKVIVPDADSLPSEAELYAAYAERVFYGETAAFGTAAGDRLTGDAKRVYDALVPVLRDIAAGDRSAAVISVGKDIYGYGVDADVDLSGDFMYDSYFMFDLLNALLSDMPYEMYWFNKTIGMVQLTSWYGDDYLLEFIFSVSDNYNNGAYETVTFQMEDGTLEDQCYFCYTDTSRTGRACAAADYAREVAAMVQERYSSDYDRLVAYKDWICAAVSYDDDAAHYGDYSVNNDPWQLIYVFDNDSSTNVVCEGYAKAFQYLCDLTAWDADIVCYNVTGQLLGEGEHMWNIVTIDGNSYLVDVTDSDAGTVGDDGSVFLVGGTPDAYGYYTFSNEYGNLSTYAYDYDTEYQWGDTGILTLSETDFRPGSGTEQPDDGQTYQVIFDANGGENAPEPQTKVNGEDLVLVNWGPWREGYRFCGWSTDPNALYGEYWPGDVYTANADLTLYAVWKQNGVIPSDVEEETFTGSIAFQDDWLLYTFTPDETAFYEFESIGTVDTILNVNDYSGSNIGFDDDSGTSTNFKLKLLLTEGLTYELYINPYNSSYIGSLDFKVTRSDVTGELYAITYHANGGGGAPATHYKAENLDMPLSGQSAYCFGRNFMGWSTRADSETVEYFPYDVYTGNQDLDLYAVWEDGDIIPGNTTDGSFTCYPQFANQIKYYKFVPEKSGMYRFESDTQLDAWAELYDIGGMWLAYSDDDGTEWNFRMEYPLEAGKTYYLAVSSYNRQMEDREILFTVTRIGDYEFENPDTCMLVYDTNNGNGIWNSASYSYGAYVTLDSNVLDFNDHTVTFRGWALNSDSEVAHYLPGDLLVLNSDTVLYAVWEPATVIPSNTESGGFSAYIPFAQGYEYFAFTPDTSAVYSFESSGTQDTCIHLYDAQGNSIGYSDDDGVDMNFRLLKLLEAGETYYLRVKYWGNITGSIGFDVIKEEEIADTDACTVTYHANGGGMVPAAFTCEPGTTIYLDTIAVPRPGYTFRGWVLNSSGDGVLYFPGQEMTVAGNLDLYAFWETAQEIFAGTPETSYFTADILFSGNEAFFRFVPEKSGVYSFESTNSSMDPYVSLYDAVGSYITNNDDGGEGLNFRLEFEMTAGETYYIGVKLLGNDTGSVGFTVTRISGEETGIFTLTYDANGGSGGPDPQYYEAGAIVYVTDYIPTRMGYTFGGWHNTADNTVYYPVNQLVMNSDVTLHALWAPATVIPADVESVTMTAEIIFPYGDEFFAITPEEDTFYSFESTGDQDTYIELYSAEAGYLTYDDDGGENWNFLLTYSLKADETYYVRVYMLGSRTGEIPFTVTKLDSSALCTITYDANGGEGAPDPQVKPEGSDIALSYRVPYRNGYSFMGWATAPDAAQAEYYPGSTYEADEDLVLYAIWQEIPTQGTCGNDLTWNFDRDSGNLTIQGTGTMSLYNAPNWHPFSNDITTVVMDEGVANISEYAFNGHWNLSGLEIPDTVTDIAYRAFANCGSLEAVELPESLQSLGADVFSGSSVHAVEFKGDAPVFTEADASGYGGSFSSIRATAYYPADNATWTEEVRSSGYGGDITWVPAGSNIFTEQYILDRIHAGDSVITLDVPIVLQNDFILPRDIELYIQNELVVPEGVTLVLNGFCEVGARGTLRVEEGGHLIFNQTIWSWSGDGSAAVEIAGTYEAVNGATIVASYENGSFTTNVIGVAEEDIGLQYYIHSADDMLDAWHKIENDRYGYYYLLIHEDLTLPCDMTLPGNSIAHIEGNATVTVPYGCTLTNEGTLYVWDDTTLYNEGTVENNGYMAISGGAVINDGEFICSPDSRLENDGTWQGDDPYQPTMTQDDLEAAIAEAGEFGYDLLQPVTLERDLTLAEDQSLFIGNGGYLTVPEDVTLTVEGYLSVLPGGALDVQGDFDCRYNIEVVYYRGNSGAVMGVPDEYIGMNYNIWNAEELPNACQQLADRDFAAGYIYLLTDAELTEDLTFPANTYVHLRDGVVLTVAEGVTLTNNAELYVWEDQQLVNNGTIHNNCYMGIMGYLTNNGTININNYLMVDDSGVVRNNGTVTLNGGGYDIFGTWNGAPISESAPATEQYIQNQIDAGNFIINVDKDIILQNDFSIPAGLMVNIKSKLIVPDGTTLTLHSGAAMIGKGHIQVEEGGVLRFGDAIYCWSGTTVNVLGSYEKLNDYAVIITYYENGTFASTVNGVAEEDMGLYYNANSLDDLLDAVDMMSDSNYRTYQIDLTQSVTLTGNLTIPENCTFDLDNTNITLTIPAEYVLINNGKLIIWDDATIHSYGTVENHGDLLLYGTLFNDGRFYNLGKIQFVNHGVWNGNAPIEGMNITTEQYIQNQIDAGKFEIVVDQDITITRDFYLPDSVSVLSVNANITVAEGVTFGIRGVESLLYSGSILVEEDAHLELGALYLSEGCTVEINGTYECVEGGYFYHYYVGDTCTTTITGVDEEDMAVRWFNFSQEEFEGALQVMSEQDYSHYITWVHSDLIIDEEITIPENCDVCLAGEIDETRTFIIDKKGWVNNNGSLNLSHIDMISENNGWIENYGSIFVDGTFANNGFITNYGTLGGYAAVTNKGAINNLGGMVELRNSITIGGELYCDNGGIIEILGSYEVMEDAIIVASHADGEMNSEIIGIPESVQTLSFGVYDEDQLLDALDIVEEGEYKNYIINSWGEITVNQDISIPENCILQVGDFEMIIAEDVTLTNHGTINAWMLPLTIQGSLMNYGTTNVYGELVNNGTFVNHGTLNILGIWTGNPAVGLNETYLQAQIDAGKTEIVADIDLTFGESFTVPEGVTLIVEEGVTLRFPECHLNVMGTLENNGTIHIGSPIQMTEDGWYQFNSGLMVQGTMVNNGEIFCDESAQPSNWGTWEGNALVNAPISQEVLETNLAYTGDMYYELLKPVTLERNMTINGSLMILEYGSLIVPEGITLTVANKEIQWALRVCGGGVLDVQGELILPEYQSVMAWYSDSYNSDPMINGVSNDRIWNQFAYYGCDLDTAIELLENHRDYAGNMVNAFLNGEETLNQDLTINTGDEFYIYGPGTLVIPEDVTVTVKGALFTMKDVTVQNNGTVVKHGHIVLEGAWNGNAPVECMTQDELEEALAGSFSGVELSAAVTLERDLVLTNQLTIEEGGALIVPEGITLTVMDYEDQWTLCVCSGGMLDVQGEIVLEGNQTVEARYNDLDNAPEIHGVPNAMIWNVFDGPDLETAITLLADHVGYAHNLVNAVMDGDETLSEDLTIRAEDDLGIYGEGTLTIPEGVILTIDGIFGICTPGITVINNGTIVNNSVNNGYLFNLGTIVNNGTVINRGTINNEGTWEGNAPVAGIITDNGRTLSLAGVIFINQYVKVEGFEGVDIEKNGGLLIWNSAVSEEDALFGTQDDLVEGLIKGNGEYAQQTPGIVAKAYADNLYFRIYIKDNDGNYVYGPLKTYSVRQYCEAQLAKATAKETLKNACAGLLHFGAAAQTYFKYNLDNLANQNILDTYPQPAWDASLLTALETPNTKLTGTGTVTDNGKTLSLTGALLVNFYFGLDASVGTPETAELLFWDEVAGELTLENVTYRKDLIASGGEYAAQSDMFAAREFGKTIFACAHFVDAEGNDHYSDVVAYSPEQYAAGRLEKSKDANMIALMKAMVTYGEAARLYFAK